MPSPPLFSTTRKSLQRIIFLLLVTFLVLQYRLFTAPQQQQPSHTTLSRQEYPRTKNERIPSQRLKDPALQSPFASSSIHPLCSKIPIGATAASIWNQNINLIYNATIHPNDRALSHAKWTKELLKLLTPSVLQTSLKAMPWSHQSLHRIYTKLYNRLQTKDSEPLKIFVFGGSIVEGVGCDSWGKELKVRKNKTSSQLGDLRQCAWPWRLEHWLQTIVGPPTDSIKVENLAVGGTNSEAATPLLDYWLSPVFEPHGADIIINAYSANDNLPPAIFAKNTTGDHFHLYRIMRRNMGFIQSALKSRPCQDVEPIIVYVDDYLGNQQDSIVGEGSLQEMVHLLTQWNGLGHISAADMVRPWVLANTSETVFSPKWTNKAGLPVVNVHFGMSGHVTTLLAVAYGMLHTTLEFCEESRRRAKCANRSRNGVSVGSIDKDVVLPQLQDQAVLATPPEIVELDLGQWESVVKGTRNSSVLPDMTHLCWSNASQVWKDYTKRQKHAEQVYCQSFQHPQNGGKRSPCVFAFLAAPLGTHQGEQKLYNFLRPFIAERNFLGGWQPQNNFRHGGFQNKLGLVATREKATVTFDFPNIQTPVRVLTIHYLKSYGPKWEDSTTKFTLVILNNNPGAMQYKTEFMLEGFHDQNTSISYPFRLDLTHENQAPVGSSIQFRMDLIGGRTFKINAMMFCSR